MPEPPEPAGPYSPVVFKGFLAFVSAQPPKMDGLRIAVGRFGETVNATTLGQCLEVCGMNILAQLAATPGGLDSVEAMIRTTIYVATDGSPIPDDCDRQISAVFAPAFGVDRVGSIVICGVDRLMGDSPAVVDAVASVRYANQTRADGL